MVKIFVLLSLFINAGQLYAQGVGSITANTSPPGAQIYWCAGTGCDPAVPGPNNPWPVLSSVTISGVSPGVYRVFYRLNGYSDSTIEQQTLTAGGSIVFNSLMQSTYAALSPGISAFPNPCVVENGVCAPNIAWHAKDLGLVVVRVSEDGGPEGTFACGVDIYGNWSQSAPWITSGHSFEFKLYRAYPDCSTTVGTPIAEVTVSALPAALPEPQPAVGINKFDLMFQYLGADASSIGFDATPGQQKVLIAMGQKAIIDAKNNGIKYFRMPAAGYGPIYYGGQGDLDLWQRNPSAFWASVDMMVGDMNAAGIKLVPSFVWFIPQFPAMTNETTTDLFTNPESKSYKLLTKYIAEFIGRYKNDPVILFYELGNEFSVYADIDMNAACLWSPPAWDVNKVTCPPQGRYTTNEMIAFGSRLAAYIRKLDPTRRIATGHGLPRSAAEHLRLHPDWFGGGGNWTTDTGVPSQLPEAGKRVVNPT